MVLSDKVFLSQFEQKTLCPSEFNHRGHLRLAWLYLTTGDFEWALKRITVGIVEYALSLGVTDKFHYTLTDAIIRIMKNRIEQQGDSTFEVFLESHPDLLENMMSVVYSYYSEPVLNSSEAKLRFVPPDIRELPQT
jgi:hypothetical protein